MKVLNLLSMKLALSSRVVLTTRGPDNWNSTSCAHIKHIIKTSNGLSLHCEYGGEKSCQEQSRNNGVPRAGMPRTGSEQRGANSRHAKNRDKKRGTNKSRSEREEEQEHDRNRI
jgi:hypothetical protein